MNKTWAAVLTGAIIIAGAGFGVNQIFAGQSDPALTVQEASEKAEERYPGKVLEIEKDHKGSRLVYELELEGPNGIYEIEMDANTGEVLKVEQGVSAKQTKDDTDDMEKGDKQTADDNQKKTNKNKKRIDFKEAKQIALNKFRGKIEEIELDEDDGRLVYEVEIKKGKQEAEFEIDANTGEILFMSIENDD
ncbi:peptidase [Kroppenstedtia guangzhouensis]|uniref:Peptidase n=1 Tax=Kroppenstedtia guangzhouensis TaxID=1274356 RepID=A0ABQ1H689_9BACL|nr:PepSY domain-containing protein [Kroppenstedtia guangzhouensis]GGA59233.1 peptidase [Kroppenstedtia guangzhouensis]